MKARVTVTLKSGILDPQGKAIEGALKSLGVDGVASVRQGKVFDIELAGDDKAKAEAALKAAADKLLANTVIENYRVELLGQAMVVTDREIYELVLEVSRDLVRVEASVDELLAGVRALNRELSSDSHTLATLRGDHSRASTQNMKSAVLVFPGINRERDMARALRMISGHEPAMVWHAETALPKGTDLVVVPGGFSYGDYLRCGAIAARAPVMDAVRDHAAKGGLVLGVCNGFQILCESGLLPGVLMRNDRLKFICKDVHLRVERSDSPFTRGYNAGQVIRVPVAHGEGNYAADEETLKRLNGDGRVLYRYCSADGEVGDLSNINGAAHSIAGIVNESGNVLGMMPHPENHVEDIMGCTDGRGLFAGLVAHLDRAA